MTSQEPGSRFSLQNTPVYGVTSGDEYYPSTSMAGNIAYITSTVPGMTYPHAVNELPKMSSSGLNAFYSEFCERVSTPTFHKRVLFVGSIFYDLQYGIPFMLHLESDHRTIYEPLRLKWKPLGTLKSFYSTFGYCPQNDLVVVGATLTEEDKAIVSECEDNNLECRNVSDFLDSYRDLLQKIEQESEQSNLSSEHINKVRQSIRKSEQATRGSVEGDQ